MAYNLPEQEQEYLYKRIKKENFAHVFPTLSSRGTRVFKSDTLLLCGVVFIHSYSDALFCAKGNLVIDQDKGENGASSR